MYKYLSLDSQYGKENLRRLIENMELWFSGPEDFNDPYECLPIFVNDLTPKQVQSRYLGIKKSDFQSLKHQNDREVWMYMQGIKYKNIRKTINAEYIKTTAKRETEEIALEFFRTTGVSCFSAEPTSSVMWAYYASSHSGICIELEKLGGARTNVVVQNVLYLNERPQVCLSEVAPGATTEPLNWTTVEKFVFTKSVRWEHEREIRLAKTRAARSFLHLENYKISSIIIGTKCTKENEQFVLSLATVKQIPIKYAQLCQLSFDIMVGNERIPSP